MRIQEIINEGGWDTTLTQGTVLKPAVVGIALKVIDQFVNDFNRYLKQQGIPEIRRGQPTGSSAYHEIDTKEDPEKIYGDIDLQMIIQEQPGLTFGQITDYWNKLSDQFIRTSHLDYVDVSESKPGHPIFKIGPDSYVQVDFMWHVERLAKWGAARVTPERGIKGLLSGNMFSVFGELLDMSIQHAGVQLKVIDDQHVPFSKKTGVKVVTITTNPETFIYDIFKYEADQLDVEPKVDPLLKKAPGLDVNDIKISRLVTGIKGFARSVEASGMFGHGDFANFTSADDFLQKFINRYTEKALADTTSKKRDKATTPEAIARAKMDKEKVLQGLEMVQGLFK